MKVFLVIFCLIAETFLALALVDDGLERSEIKKLDDWGTDDIDLSLEETSPDAQRKRDPGYHYSKPNRFPSSSFSPRPSRFRGKIVTKLHNQLNRPFKQYGPPNHASSPQNHNRPTSSNSIFNQEVPAPQKQTEFVQESPIASQNNLPFGQHTANYLPPKNQKLPSVTAPYLFSNQNHDFPNKYHQQQLQLQIQEQQQYNQHQQYNQQQQYNQNQQYIQNQQYNQNQQFNKVQQQYFDQVQPQQDVQFPIDNQNSFGQDFRASNFNQQQGEINNQQISDAAQFLSQNAPAISQLYDAPAANQNYAPYDQESHQESEINNPQPQSQNQAPQLQFFTSGITNTQQALEQVKSLEKDRLINQLRLELSSRENGARFVQNNEGSSNTNAQESIVSQFSPSNRASKLNHVESSFSQSVSYPSPPGSLGYQAFYPPPAAAPPTQPPVLATPSPFVTTTFQPSQVTSETSNTHIGTGIYTPDNTRLPTTSTYPQYGGFVPTLVSPTNFIPSIPTYGTTLFPATAIKPSDNSPTHFGIPIPTLPNERPVHLPPTPIAAKPTSISLHPGISTVSVPLGPVHHFPSRPQIIKPSPVPVIPAATPVHPTYGIRPPLVNPSLIFKPVKVYPVYHYPHLGYSPPGRKSIYSTIQTHPWSYAPSFAQAKPIWK